MPSLTEFLRQARRTPFVWGRFDCCLFAADWVKLCTGEDPAAAWRGTYSTEDGAAEIMRQAGGMVALLDQVMMRSDEPMVGVLNTDQGEACAVRGGQFWYVLTPDGTAMIDGVGVGFEPCRL